MTTDPVLHDVLIAAIVAVLLLVQTWAQEKRRKIETESARELQAEANATKVVEKLTGTPASAPASATPAETPDAKRGG